MTDREHQWKDISEKDPKSYWVRRTCKICHLEDTKLRVPDGTCGHRNDWSVKTPCIEPVPRKIPYDVLTAELAQHDVREEPIAIGVPGEWQVGFTISGDGGRSAFPYEIEVKDLELGWAELLRWIRARQYDVDKYSNFSYMKSLAHHRCGCCDDD